MLSVHFVGGKLQQDGNGHYKVLKKDMLNPDKSGLEKAFVNTVDRVGSTSTIVPSFILFSEVSCFLGSFFYGYIYIIYHVCWNFISHQLVKRPLLQYYKFQGLFHVQRRNYKFVSKMWTALVFINYKHFKCQVSCMAVEFRVLFEKELVVISVINMKG